MLCELKLSLLLINAHLILLCNAGKDHAVLYINGVDVNAHKTGLRPGHAHYSFIDGEIVAISCTNYVGVSAKMEYFNSSGSQILKTGLLDQKPVTLKLKLRKSSHRSYVHCIADSSVQVISKLVFQLQSSDTKDSLEVFVNNAIIHPQMSNQSYMSTKSLYYRSEDKIQMRCRKKFDDTNETMFLIINHNGVFNESDSAVSLDAVSLSAKDHITCKLVSVSTLIVKEYVDIEFLLDPATFYVTGFLTSNIIEEYKPTKEAVFMKYEYSSEEYLTLVCTKHTKNTPGLKWIVNGVEEKNIMWRSSEGYYTPRTLRLQPRHDNMSIRCEDTFRGLVVQQIVIQFSYRPIAELNPQQQEMMADTEIGGWLLALVGCGTGVVMVTVGCFIFFYRRTKRNRQRNCMSYDNLSSHTDSTLPHPSQWKEPIYSEPIFRSSFKESSKDCYATPIPKRDRGQRRDENLQVYRGSEHVYEVIGDPADRESFIMKINCLYEATRKTEPYAHVSEAKCSSEDTQYHETFQNCSYDNSRGSCVYEKPM